MPMGIFSIFQSFTISTEILIMSVHISKYLLTGRAAGPGPALPRGGAAIFGTAPGARLNTIKVTANLAGKPPCRSQKHLTNNSRLLET